MNEKAKFNFHKELAEDNNVGRRNSQDINAVNKSIFTEPSGNMKNAQEESKNFTKQDTSLINATKIDKNMNLDSMLMNSYIEPLDASRRTNKSSIAPKTAIQMTVQTTKVKIVWSMIKVKKFLYQGVEGEKPFKEMSLYDKSFYIFLDTPFNFIRRITIPPGSPEQWNRTFAWVSPFWGMLFAFAVTGFYDYMSAPPIALYVCAVITIMLGILIWFTTPKLKPPRAMILFSIVWFAMSILWIFFIAGVLVDVITLIGELLELDPPYLGVTILAGGMSMADLKVNAAVAKKGLARMALTGCFAGPMFNLLVGLGVSIIITIASGNGAPAFEYDNSDGLIPIIGILGLLCMLIMILIISCISKFKLKKIQAVFHFVFYTGIMILLTVATFTFAS